MQRLLMCLVIGLAGSLTACDSEQTPDAGMTPDGGDLDMMPEPEGEPEPEPDTGGEPEPEPDGGEPEPEPDMGGEPEPDPDMAVPDMQLGECQPGDTSGLPCAELDGVCAGGIATCTADREWGECEPPPNYEADETRCDGIDSDCDGLVDEAFPGVGAPCDSEDEDQCAYGLLVCNPAGDGVDCVDDDPVTETCNNIDDDCDGSTDEAVADPPLSARQDGVCGGQVSVCVAGEWVEPDYSVIEGYEAGESLCDGVDNDCDGRTDAGLFPPPADLQAGVCAGQIRICGGADGWVEPDYEAIRRFEADEVSCDGIDNDCDGTSDEAIEPPPCDLTLGVCAVPLAPRQCLGAAGFSGCTYSPDYEVDETNTCDALDNDCDGQIDEGEPCPVNLRTVRVEPGAFIMGSPPDEPGHQADEAEHPVTLTRAMLVRITEVSQAEWVQLMGENPSARPGADLPVEQITWLDAVRFANALSRRDGLPQCYQIEGEGAAWPDGYDCLGWRLPTEAEWEYLARGGTEAARWNESEGVELNRAAWYNDNSEGQSRPVGTRAANPFGLHDVLGNVNEWVWDLYGPYPEGEQVDPLGPDAGAERNVRGGAYPSRAPLLRSANRAATPPRTAAGDIGLRVLRTAPPGIE